MGANAQTAVPVFTAGQVLTAQQQTEINTGIPVFATTVTRDAAFGGAGEKTLAEGQFAYIEATNATQYYDGAAWQSVGTTPGLSFVTGATFTTATSFSLPTATFSATYQNYRIMINVTDLTADATFTMRMRVGGADVTSSDYQYGFMGIRANNGAATNLNGAAVSAWTVGESNSDGTDFFVADFDIFNPFSTVRTEIQGNQSMCLADNTSFIFRSGGGAINLTTSYDSLSFISSVASSMTGFYRVYGYSES